MKQLVLTTEQYARTSREDITNADRIIVDNEVVKDRNRATPYNLRDDAEQAVRTLLEFCGEDPARGGLLETPKRFVKALEFWTHGHKLPPDTEILKCFEDGAERYDEMVVQRDIPLWSLCEHHMAPFFGVAHIAYVPSGKVVGLSKLTRLTDKYARRLQVQERVTSQVAHALMDNLQPLGVGVVLECRHTCMESRGVCKSGTVTQTSCLLGVLKEKPEARQEFFDLIRRR